MLFRRFERWHLSRLRVDGLSTFVLFSSKGIKVFVCHSESSKEFPQPLGLIVDGEILV